MFVGRLDHLAAFVALSATWTVLCCVGDSVAMKTFERQTSLAPVVGEPLQSPVTVPVIVAVNVTGGRPATVAVTVAFPALGPAVYVVDASPSTSVVDVAELSEPPPAVIAHD